MNLMMEAIHLAFDTNLQVVKFIQEITAKEGKEKAPYTEYVIPEDAYQLVTGFITDARMEDAVFAELKQDRDAKIKALTEEGYRSPDRAADSNGWRRNGYRRTDWRYYL